MGPQKSELPLESHVASGDLSLSGWGRGILNVPTLSGLGCLCTAGTVLAWKLDSERVSWKQPGPYESLLYWFYMGPQGSPGSSESIRCHLLVEGWRGGLAEEPGKKVSQQPGGRGGRL